MKIVEIYNFWPQVVFLARNLRYKVFVRNIMGEKNGDALQDRKQNVRQKCDDRFS